MGRQEKQEIIVFSVMAIILSSLICFVAYKTGNPNLSILSVFTPSVLALVYTAINKGKKGVDELFVKQTIKKTKFKWLLISLLGIPLIASLAVLRSLNFELSKFSLRTSQLMPQMVIIVLIALGEEYGWRGFLLPRLMNRFSLFSSAIILGFILGFLAFSRVFDWNRSPTADELPGFFVVGCFGLPFYRLDLLLHKKCIDIYTGAYQCEPRFQLPDAFA